MNIESAATLLSVFELLDVTPFESLHLRHTLLEVDGIARLIDQAQNEAEKIRHQTAEISKSVDLNLAPSREDCAKYAVICANAGNMSFLDGGFRSAQRSWRGMSRSSGKVSKAQMAQGYRILVQHFDGLTAFDNNQRYRAALGILFDGLKTPFAEIRKLLSWQAAVRQKFAPTSEMAASTAKALLSAAADNLSALKALRQSRSTEIAAFQKFIDEFQTYTHNLPAFLHQEAYGDWRILAALFKDWAEHFRATIAPFHELRLNPDLPLSEIPQLLSSLRKLLHLNAEIQVSQAAIAAHEFGPISIETDIAAVTKTIEFVDNLEASSLSEEIKKWLITSDIEERIEQLTSAINLLGEYY
ncbi:MAG: hypothetical protein LH647_13395, partial [Leptolyngbyaceae cyanobacterium CAN_BIN12]|nr:hypothetical protein [Leptolyngbyaceae cyanobacterium CAN_BIN12]